MKYNFFCFFRSQKKNIIRRDIIFGSRQSNNCFFNRTLFSGGILFFLIGFPNSRKIFLLLKNIEIKFIPQGIVICLYGRLGVILSLYSLTRRFWLVGRGFNEYNKEQEKIYILRFGFPGTSRRLEFSYLFSDLENLQVESKKQLLTTSLNLYLLLKNRRKIILMQPNIENINTLKDIERYSANLAKFLQVPLKITLIFFVHLIASSKNS
jgi:hypothetical protein